MGLFDDKPFGGQQSSLPSEEKTDAEQPQSPVISAKNVSKSYGLTEAVKDLSLEVPRGSVYALLGPNGAGKTTFVKCLLGLVHFHQGELKLQGIPVERASSRAGTAYLPEKFSYYPYYTVSGVLRFFAQLHGQNEDKWDELVTSALKRAGIEDLAERKLKTLSKGQLQRTGIASLLVSECDTFILDEPFSGLDPMGMKEIKQLIVELKEEGKTLFINSHILSEIEKVCDRVAILHNGRCLSQGKIEDLLQGQTLEDYFYDKIQTAKKELS